VAWNNTRNDLFLVFIFISPNLPAKQETHGPEITKLGLSHHLQNA
jgi:hypothetical protein